MPGTFPGEVDTAILTAINRYSYLTAAQLTRLRYPMLSDQCRYARRRLHSLTEAGYLLRLSAFPTPQYGSAPYAFTLSHTGRAFLSQQGIPVPDYVRPNEQASAVANPIFMRHTLAVIDVLIAAERLTQDVPAVSLTRLRTERELRRSALRVAPNPQTPERTVAVIPDAWFELTVTGRKPVAIALELDRATERQARWRAKVAALAAWAAGPYKQAFQATNLTIAVLTPSRERALVLADWTARQINQSGVHPKLSELFVFGSVQPSETPPEELFFLPLWATAGTGNRVSLLDVLPTAAVKEVRPKRPSP